MIQALSLQNFKCFETLRLDLTPLTLLTGFNAAGKSTSLQTLLLLSQTLRGQHGVSELRLNGPLVTLGSPGDVINAAGGNRLALGVATSDVELLWHFAVPEENRRSLRVTQLDVRGENSSSVQASDLNGIRPVGAEPFVRRALTLLDRLVFLSAARQVETDVFPVPSDMGGPRGDVGPIGEFAAWWLYQEGDSNVPLGRRCKSDAASSTLRHQVNAWAAYLFPNCEINALPIPKTTLMRLELRSGLTSDWSRPANIGYGISYAFPILIAGLCANEGRPVIVDSPEAHLHPRGQSRIGSFLAQMASADAQILVETHSDHVLNGIRIAVRERVIDPTQVTIYFFTNQPDAQVVRLSVDQNGTVSDWPEGFFDQSESDLASLAGWA
jgi:Protein of unknown function (DUF3696)/AAA ATPase domain/AAA domain, putative AbiEii toxin, Type IV TA system